MLASGSDDQYLRIWDVHTACCRQEVTDHAWGQVTNLSLLDSPATQQPVMFIGTGRGLVSVQLFTRGNMQLARRTATSVRAFELNDSIECQALDPFNSRFAVGSHRGHIKMYNIQNRSTLVLMYTLDVASDIPRHLVFLNDSNTELGIHTLRGKTLSLDASNGVKTMEGSTREGGIGSVAFASDGQVKVVHNLIEDKFDLYSPLESPSTTTLAVSANSGKIKGAAFAESGRIVVCGADDGLLHIFDIVKGIEQPSQRHTDCSTIVAVTTCSTADEHLIASGGSETPASIYIWGRATEGRQLENKRLELTQQIENDRAKQALADKKLADEEADAGQKQRRCRTSR
ncbi:WD40-repeat-containing domain protein [Mycena crocata]|nr:WD40-repeat-containing domain protein [Mycena crocata]